MQDKHKPKPKISVVSNLSIPLCILTLLWLGSSMVSCSVISPMDAGGSIGIGSKVYAEGEAEVNNLVYDGTTESEVEISFNPTYGSGSVTPVGNLSDTAVVTMQAGVRVQNSGGYSVYLGSSNPNLVGTHDETRVIPTLPKDTTVTLDNLPANTWGYYVGSSVGDDNVDGSTEGSSNTIDTTMVEYKAIASGRGDVIHENLSSKIVSDSMNFILAFAARVDSTVPADTYTNTMTLSVVSNPLKVATFDGILTMQQMTPDVCSRAHENDTAYLMDIRDGNKYWVTKLKDGNCWMTQNLALDLVEGQVLTSETTDIPMITNADGSKSVGSWVVPKSTNKDDYTCVGDSQVTNCSWRVADAVLRLPDSVRNVSEYSPEDGGILAASVVVDVNGWKISTDPNFTMSARYLDNGKYYDKQINWTVDPERMVYDAHYLTGNYYQWLSASAGAEVEFSTNGLGSALSSICPRGWKLPYSGTSDDIGNINRSGSIYNLLSNYGLQSVIKNDIYNVALAPLFISRVGDIMPITNKIAHVGHLGTMRTNLASATMNQALQVITTDKIINTSVQSGYSVRCLVIAE